MISQQTNAVPTTLARKLHVDYQWLEQLENLTKKILKHTNFGVATLAYELHMSERQLQRRVKRLTGFTPLQYLREMRLQAARSILEEGRYRTVAETGYAVGFSSIHYFSTLYSKRFGKRPAEYLRVSYVC